MTWARLPGWGKAHDVGTGGLARCGRQGGEWVPVGPDVPRCRMCETWQGGGGLLRKQPPARSARTERKPAPPRVRPTPPPPARPVVRVVEPDPVVAVIQRYERSGR